MIRYYITDRKQAGGMEPLLAAIARNIAAGVEWIQIREKDLSGRQLADLVRSAVSLRGASATKILVNTRADIAIACGADGVHLPSDTPLLAYGIPGLLIGVSCHTISDLRQAEAEGASFAVYGPVFPPLSKAFPGAAIGLNGLQEGCLAVRIPVLALGGITRENESLCVAAGAAGVAGITLFQSRQ